MERRQFLNSLAGLTAGVSLVGSAQGGAEPQSSSIEGYTELSQFKLDRASWTVYENLATRNGGITFVSSSGRRRQLSKSAEPTFAQADPPYLGLKLADIGAAERDLLADKLLDRGDPDPEVVRLAAPPLGSNGPNPNNPFARLTWNTIVGTRECFDTMPVYPGGNTRTYHPVQYFPELTTELALKRYEGLAGGWMPAVRKVMPVSASSYYELLIFGDVEAKDKFIVQTWHRTMLIKDGKISKVVFGYSYPAFPPARNDPRPEEFYRALLAFAEYWEKQLNDFVPASVPGAVWIDMSRYAFAKELMVRPGGTYPKYGAVDRDYYGSEYDGFQDVFTSSVYANLEWGRFAQARATIDNYFSDFVDSNGAINMRGPETAQFGLTLSLWARYIEYTKDAALMAKHREKIAATAKMLLEMHDRSLNLSKGEPGYGLIAGWSESDACLAPKPETWWQPYFANSAFAARGLKDISRVWHDPDEAARWRKRAETLREAVVASIERNVRRDVDPPYIGTLPGAKLTFRESMAQEHPSPQQWPHRAYAELLQADVLPPELANLVIDCMRAYGATTMGVVANVGRPRATGRDILGFISYGYAQMLLRLDRIEEYLLFLYAHRFHDHTPGSWTAGEVAGITGGNALFCIPAQLTIPVLVRWMLVLDDSDEERLYLGKGLPREWVASGKQIRIDRAPTRWGRVDFQMKADLGGRSASATVQLAGSKGPEEIEVKFRTPLDSPLQSATVNGVPAAIGGVHKDCVMVKPGERRRFEIKVLLSGAGRQAEHS